jgi:hypothetical protein
MSTLQRNLNLLIECNKCTKRGLTTSDNFPSYLDGTINKECVCFLKRYRSTFSFEQGLSALRLCDLQAYIKNGILGYVIQLPLVNRGNYNIRGLLLEKYPTFGREKETGLLGALDT